MLNLLLAAGETPRREDWLSLVSGFNGHHRLPDERRLELLGLLLSQPATLEKPSTSVLFEHAASFSDEVMMGGLLKHLGGVGGIDDRGGDALVSAAGSGARPSPICLPMAWTSKQMARVVVPLFMQQSNFVELRKKTKLFVKR